MGRSKISKILHPVRKGHETMYVFDLDGTLSIVGDRLKYIKQKPKDFDTFYSLCNKDKPNRPIFEIYEALYHQGYPLKIVTGRREDTRDMTLKWFEFYGLIVYDDDLHMRGFKDYRPATELKPELIKPFSSNIRAIFEDQTAMVNKWRELGYLCLEVK